MIGSRPNFMDSPYLVADEREWYLKEGAPKEVVKEFNEFMNESDSGGFVKLPELPKKSKKK